MKGKQVTSTWCLYFHGTFFPVPSVPLHVGLPKIFWGCLLLHLRHSPMTLTGLPKSAFLRYPTCVYLNFLADSIGREERERERALALHSFLL